MSQATVALTIGGQTYRVRSAATEQELRRLAATVDARLRLVAGASQTAAPSQALLLVAIALAHDLEHELLLRKQLERETQNMLQLILDRIDGAIQSADARLTGLGLDQPKL
jgi:cell division protein ZapA (FtsZ GTPase activity inhibitor)